MTRTTESNYFNSRRVPSDAQFQMEMGRSMSHSSMNMTMMAANNYGDPGSLGRNNCDSMRNQTFDPRTSGVGGSRFHFENRNVESNNVNGFGQGYCTGGLDAYSNRSNDHFQGSDYDGNTRNNF